MYLPDFKFLKQVFDHAKKNRSIKAASLGYAHFTWAEKEGFTELINMLHLAFTEYDFEDLRGYYILLQTLLEKPGFDLSENRFE